MKLRRTFELIGVVLRMALLAAIALTSTNRVCGQATWVHFGGNGQLVYNTDNLGNRLPDFSYAGYMGGGVALPTNVPVKLTLSPSGGDDTSAIQNGINTVSALTPDTNGFRGALFLSAGTYNISGTLNLSASGVVLRGAGNNTSTGTVLLVTGLARNILTVGGSGSWTQTGGTYSITDSYVPLGATNFHIALSGITWGTNVTASADTDVFTNGTLAYAYNWTGTNQTVNGVTFTGTTSTSAGGNYSLSGIGSNYRGYTSSATPFSALSAAYQSILVGAEYNSSAATATVTLNSLTAGHVYAVQVWVNDPRGGGTIGRTATLAGANSVTLAYNVPAATGGVGQYSIGVFTASSGSQTFSLTSSSSPQLNALLVSDVTTTGYQPVNPAPASAGPFSAGNTIIVQRPQTQPWINALGMNVTNINWQPGTGLQFERQVTAVSNNQITIDVPLCNPIEQSWTTGLVYQVTDSARIQQVGIENLCAVGQIADYPSNILTGVFVNYQNLKNSWMRNVLLSGWGNAVSLGSGLKWCTVQDCQYTNPATGTSSAAPAAWTIGNSGAMCLFQRCNSDGGYYHIMVTQAGTPGPNVFLNFNCTGTHYNGGPHQRWAAGALHDNILMAADSQGGYTPYLAINNRGTDGSGQGWAAGFSLMYNCQVPQFQLEQPAGVTNTYNWAIGGIGSKQSYSDPGTYDTFGSIVSPKSLYIEQLRERLGGAAVEAIGYLFFTVASTQPTQTVNAGSSTSFSVQVAATNGFNDNVALSVGGLPAGATPTFTPGSIGGSGSSTLLISTTGSTPAGAYPLTITGTSSNAVHSAAVTLTVNATAQFTVSATPPTQTVAPGAGTNFAVTVTASNGFNGTVTLGLSGLPPGGGASFNPPTVSGSGGSTLTLTTTAGTPAGSYPLTITGTNGSTSSSTVVTLVVNRGVANLRWAGTNSGVWDVTNTFDWFNPNTAAPDQFYQGDSVLLDDTPGVTNNLALGSGIAVAPSVLTNNSSTNNFTISGAGKITGVAALVKSGASTLTLSNANDFTGGIVVSGGVLKAGNAAALGSTSVPVVLTNAGTLDVNGLNLGAQPLTVSGAGAGGNGAIINSGPAQTSALKTVTLAGNTTFGGINRWDIRGSPAQLLTGGQPFNITKVGTNQVSLVAVNPIDAALGDINVLQGIFAVQTTSTQLGDSNKTITVYGGATLDIYRLTNSPLNKRLVFLDGSTFYSENDSNIILGPVTLNGVATFNVNNSGGAAPSLTFNNVLAGPGGVTKTGLAPLVLKATNTYAGNTLVSTGTLSLGSSGSISNSALITVASGATLDVSGRADKTLTLAAGQTLGGSGTVAGGVLVGTNATLAPGNGTGVLTVTNAVTLQGTTLMTLNRQTPTNDTVHTVTLSYGGTLSLTNAAGTLTAGDSFTLFYATNYSGAFARVLPGVPRAGLGWDLSGLTNGALRVVSAPPPPPPVIGGAMASGAGLAISGSNGVPGGQYYVLMSTNALLPLANWTRLATNVFDTNGNFSFTVAPNANAVQQFYLLQLQ